MLEIFTERARKVLTIAQEEAKNLNHDYLGTEHILLALIKEGKGVGAEVLQKLGVDFETLKLEIEEKTPKGNAPDNLGNVPFIPGSKKVLELAYEEAKNLGHNYVGTEHLLLGLIREEESIEAKILLEFGATLEKAKAEVVKVLRCKSKKEIFIPVACYEATYGFMSSQGVEIIIRFPAQINPIQEDTPFSLLKRYGLNELAEYFFKTSSPIS